MSRLSPAFLCTFLAASACLRGATPASATTTHRLSFGGVERTYLLHLPPAASNAPRPLVLMLHGRLGNGAGMVKLTRFDAIADRAGVVVAYPDGIRRSWADGRGGTPADRAGVDDVGFLLALVHEIASREKIDLARVYVAGMSNGGFMSERLACEASATFAAVGVVAATMGEAVAATCHPQREVPILYVNGTADPLVPYEGGTLGADRGEVLGAEASAALWRDADGCTGAPTERDLPDRAHDGTKVHERQWSKCRDGAAVIAYRVDGGGHAWPGGWAYLPPRMIGITSRNLDASRTLWQFFAAHHR